MEEEVPDTNKMPLTQQAAEYLDKHQIYQLFSSLVSSIAVDRPADPKTYIIQKLESSKSFKIFLLCNNVSIAQAAAEFLATQLKSRIYSFDTTNIKIDSDEWNNQIQELQTSSNFILVNVPQNRSQAQSLLESRVIPDRILLLTDYPISEVGQDCKPIELLSMKRIFKHNTRFISIPVLINNSFELTSEIETKLMNAILSQRKRPFSIAPEFAPRIVILGPPSIGKTRLALHLNKILGITYIHPNHVLSSHIRFHTKYGILAAKELGLSSENENDNASHGIHKVPKYVSNDILASMIAYDISNDKDMLRNGFILDGFPRTSEQANLLHKYGIRPNRIIILNAKAEYVLSTPQFDNKKFCWDNVNTPGITNEMVEKSIENDNKENNISISNILEGYQSSIQDIIDILSQEGGIKQFDIDILKENMKKDNEIFDTIQDITVSTNTPMITEVVKDNNNNDNVESDDETEILLVGEDLNDIETTETNNVNTNKRAQITRNQEPKRLSESDWKDYTWKTICEFAYDFVVQPLPHVIEA